MARGRFRIAGLGLAALVMMSACGRSSPQSDEEVFQAQAPAPTVKQLIAQLRDHPGTRPSIVLGDGVNAPRGGFKTGDQKLAFLSGAFVVSPNATGFSRPTQARSLMSADDAVQVLKHQSPKGPDAAEPLVITAATLAAAAFPTDRGERVLPAWSLRMAGLPDPALVLAVKPPAAVIVAGNSNAKAQTSSDGRQLTIQFVGGEPGNGPCAVNYTGRTDETALTVTVHITEHPSRATAPPNVGCTLVGIGRTLTLSLHKPLSDRLVLAGGSVVPVTTA
jgi:hypothetical protein